MRASAVGCAPQYIADSAANASACGSHGGAYVLSGCREAICHSAGSFGQRTTGYDVSYIVETSMLLPFFDAAFVGGGCAPYYHVSIPSIPPWGCEFSRLIGNRW